MKHILILLMALATGTAEAFTFTWTNTAGGDWSVAANWMPNAVPGSVDTANLTTPGTYTVTFTNAGGINLSNLTLGAFPGTQTLIQGSVTPLTVTNTGIITGGGVLNVTNGGVKGNWTVNSGAGLQLSGPTTTVLQLYFLNLVNNGTVTWSASGLEFGYTLVTNNGTWLMTNDGTMDLGGGPSVFVNNGIFRKSAGTGTSVNSGVPFINGPGGLVDGLSGTLALFAGGSLGGTLNATVPGIVSLAGSPWTEAGAVATGTGANQLTGGSLNLVTNNVPGLKLIGGSVNITGTNTFQQSGAITNLTLDGAQLNGTNRIGAGTLIFNSGAIAGQVTVSPSGQLVLATTGSKLCYGLTILNQGMVNWTGGGLSFGTTVVSNGGLWVIASDNNIVNGGGTMPVWTNAGMLRKSAGTGTSAFIGITFTNQLGGVVEADSGTVSLPSGTTNAVGSLFLNDGTITGTGTLGFTGGLLEGSGTLGTATLAGGTISPGLSGPGTMTFPSGLTLGSGATLVMDGTGTTPGSQYDQLVVTGAVTLGNATLQVSALPTVPVGTTFVIITNTGSATVSGTFNGLPENGVVSGGGQPFRIHYACGARGNAVTLVRDTGLTLTNLMTSGGNFNLTGTGGGPVVYGVQASTNLIDWTNIGTATGNTGGTFTFSDTNAPQFRYRFYRTTN